MAMSPGALARVRVGCAALLLSTLVAGFWAFRLVLPARPVRSLDDVSGYYLPLYLATWGSGRPPTWNPYQQCGVPWLAPIGAATLYPPHLLHALLPGHRMLAASSLVHLLLAAASMAILARALGLGWAPALLASALASMRGRLPGHLPHPNMLETETWLFAGAAAVYALARHPRPLSILLVAACGAASILAGYVQYTTYSFVAWAALLAGFLLAERAPPTAWLRAGGAFAAAVALGALVAGVQLLPALELAGLSTRGSGPLARAEVYAFGPPGLTIRAALDRLLVRDGSELAFSVGVVGGLLILLGLVLPGRRRLAMATVAIGLAALALALGPLTPLFDLQRRVPPFWGFRHPDRVMIVLDLCVAIAAALGLESLRRALAARLGAPAAALAMAAVLGLALAELFAASPDRHRPSYTAVGPEGVYAAEHPLFARARAGGDRVFLWNSRRRLPSKLGSVFGMRVVQDYEPMSPLRQSRYFTFLALGRPERRPRERQPYFGRLSLPRDAEGARELASRQRLLDLAAVRFVLAPEKAVAATAFREYASAAGLERVAAERELVLFENPRALPRAFVTYRWLAAPEPAELLAALAAPDFDPLAASYLETGGGDGDTQAPADGSPSAPQRGRAAAILRDEPSLVEIDAELAAPGLLVLADTFYPGWRASVDGKPARILAANHLFRAVALPPGRHRVRFEYAPASLRIGAAASLAGGAVALWLAWRARRAAVETGAPGGPRPALASPPG
jgi:hypothetical protein